MFLGGRELMQRREVSEHPAELIDTEVTRIVGEAYDRAARLIRDNVDKLHLLAAALLEHETLNRQEVETLLGPGPPRPAPARAAAGELAAV